MDPRAALQRLGGALTALVYPARCAACDADAAADAAFCPPCSLGLERLGSVCPVCGLPSEGRALRCLRCVLSRPAFGAARAPLLYGGPLALAIRRLKWGRRPDLGAPLGRLLGQGIDGDTDLIVPVPLHPRRLHTRRYNQAALLAIGALTSLRAGSRAGPGRRPRLELHALERVRDTPPQIALGEEARRHNVRGAFAVRRPQRVSGRRVLLVDDVLTTGATARAAAATLRRAGAAAVDVWVLARTP